jgi:Trk K+ transport system NAD-binding subunit
MNTFVFLIFRRMRRPLITLLLVYSVAVLGLTLIPGRDADGNVWHMSFFHAFYFVSYMGTTIGFGEIPHEFVDAQRLWVTFFIYATVIAWIYAIGTVLTLVQDKTFQSALAEMRFARRIRRFTEPFFLVAGYGQTGSELVRALTRREQHAVVVDINEQRVNHIKLENLPESVPALNGDARTPRHLLEAGLQHSHCAGVVALTDNNETNLKIAITSKLLHPQIKVICRADSRDIEDNMASFGTDYIIDPFDTFALHLATAIQAPGLYLLHEWLTGAAHSELVAPVYPPSTGTWIVCGYGRFGQAVYHRLKKERLDIVVVEATPEKTGEPEEGVVLGRGTEAETLEAAGIGEAVGLVAGTDDDANNLSIIMTARELNPDLFVVARQNHRENQALFDAVEAEIVMHPGMIIANRIRVLLATPMLYEFTQLVKSQDDAWACELISRVIAVVSSEVPDVWVTTIDEHQAPALLSWFDRGQRGPTVADLLRAPSDRDRQMPAIALMLRHNGGREIMPGPDTRVREGDSILWCGRYSVRQRMLWILQNDHLLSYAVTGEIQPQGLLWRWMERRWPRRKAAETQ